ncbi:MAG: hypothetical protein NVS1B7_8450 [Candidatus Saccharimonadales bacterium]
MTGAQEQVLPGVYMDITSRQLLVGQDAYETHIACGGYPQDIVELSTILRSYRQEPLPTYSSDRLPVNDWQREDYISYGRWLHTLVSVPESPKTGLTQRIFQYAGKLGVGPLVERIQSPARFGNLMNYYQELGVEPQHAVGKYKTWNRADYADYVASVHDSLLQKRATSDQKQLSLSQEIARLAALGKGPDLWDFQHKKWSLRYLLELSGYVNNRSWTEEEYIGWGVKFMLANDGKIPQKPDFEKLSPQRRAPSLRIIFTKFDRLKKYQALTTEAYIDACEERELRQFDRQAEIERLLEDGSLPLKLTELADTPQKLFVVSARYQLINKLMPRLSTSHKLTISTYTHMDSVIHAIQQLDPIITAGEVEETAVRLGVFDDLWPLDEYLTTLRVID